MAFRVFGAAARMKQARELVEQTYRKQLPITIKDVTDDTPYYFSIRVYDKSLKEKRDLLMAENKRKQNKQKEIEEINKTIEKESFLVQFKVKQLSINQYQDKENSVLILSTAKEKMKELHINPSLAYFNLVDNFVNMCECTNDYELVPDVLLKIRDFTYSIQMTDEKMNDLILLLYDNDFLDIEELYDLRLIESKNLIKYCKDNYIYDTIRKQGIEYIKLLANKLYNHIISSYLKTLSLNDVLSVIEAILEFNDIGVKKKLNWFHQTLMEYRKVTEAGGNNITLSYKGDSQITIKKSSLVIE